MEKADSCQRIGKNVCYIVAAVIIQGDKILMVQEAKRSCHGKWYLPAGRVEQGESFDAAVRRETFEESSLQFSPRTLTFVELQGASWMRFTFTGEINGGSLKDTPDKESLKAQWLDIDLVMRGGSEKYPLRSFDIAVNIQVTRKILEEEMKPFWFLPAIVPHQHSEIALLLTRQIRDEVPEFLANSVDCSLPHAVLGFRSIFIVVRDIFSAIFPSKPSLTAEQLSVVDLEFAGSSSSTARQAKLADGLLLVFSAKASDDLRDTPPSGPYQWVNVDMVPPLTKCHWISRVRDKNFRGVSVNFH